MKFLIAGAGNIGSIIASEIAKNPSNSVIIADINPERAMKMPGISGKKNVEFVKLDINRADDASRIINGCDMIVGALPGSTGLKLIKLAIDHGKNIVDVSYMNEDPFALDEKAKEAGVTVVPDLGVAPGLSNMMVGNSIKQLDKVESVKIMVGGMPENKVPPLDYNLTWSTEGLIDEYTRPANIVEKGVLKSVEALSGLQTVNYEGIGTLEAFYTDGLRTLLRTVKDVQEMWEKTLRYPGHAEKIRTMRDLGYFDKEYAKVDGKDVKPFDLSVKLFDRHLKRDDVRDLIVMDVTVEGTKGGETKKIEYFVYDSYDTKNRISAMSRTTAFPPSIIAQILSEKPPEEKGIVPPEILGKDDSLFETTIRKLKEKGVKVDRVC